MSISAYPLAWPRGWPRATVHKSGRFAKGQRIYGGSSGMTRYREVSVGDATDRILSELGRFGCSNRDDIVISTNVRLRLDGLPRSNDGEPSDPGAAVYWTEWNGAPRVMAIDVYDRVADNLAAIAATLDAMRAIERHGGAQVLERAFTGFAALPPPGRDWWDVLQCQRDATPEVVKAQYRRLASDHHPDKGGDAARMAEINEAYRRATA